MKRRLGAAWTQAASGFAARSARERALALIVALTLAVVIGDRLFLHPLQARIAALQQRLAALTQPASAATTVDGALALRREQLAQQLRQADAALLLVRRQLVAPREMKQTLDRLIVGLPGLRLIHLRNLAPVAMQDPAAAKPGGSEGQVYRHGFEVSLQGSYADLLQYLTRIEASDQHIYWKRVELDASSYPAVKLVLTIYTVSEDPTWLVL
jgi:MSHA biogenesis protein MshJ